MKKYYFFGLIAILTGYAACDNAAKKNADELTTYVDSVSNTAPVYTTENWQAVSMGYNERHAKVEAQESKLSDEDKAKVQAAEAKYAELKARYESEMKANEAAVQLMAYKRGFRDKLFGAGNIGDDMQFTYVTAANIKDVYQNFVDVVDANKENYSREDWDEIKLLYEALDTRKNEVEKDLSSKDNLKIAGLKIKFSTMYKLRRTEAKMEENREAKQDN